MYRCDNATIEAIWNATCDICETGTMAQIKRFIDIHNAINTAHFNLIRPQYRVAQLMQLLDSIDVELLDICIDWFLTLTNNGNDVIGMEHLIGEALSKCANIAVHIDVKSNEQPLNVLQLVGEYSNIDQ
jgi:hypothetical protein